MNKKQMIDVVRGGGGVFYGGKLIRTEAGLPSDAELAKTDAEKQAAAADLDAQIVALQAQRAELGAETIEDTSKKSGEAEDKESGKSARTETKASANK